MQMPAVPKCDREVSITAAEKEQLGAYTQEGQVSCWESDPSDLQCDQPANQPTQQETTLYHWSLVQQGKSSPMLPNQSPPTLKDPLEHQTLVFSMLFKYLDNIWSNIWTNIWSTNLLARTEALYAATCHCPSNPLFQFSNQFLKFNLLSIFSGFLPEGGS